MIISLWTAPVTCLHFITSEIPEASIEDPRVTRKDNPGFSKISAVNACAQVSWCHSVCQLLDTTLVLTSLYISGGIDFATASPRLFCFTDRKKVLYPNGIATLTATVTEQNFPLRLIDHLEDGIYNGDINTCYFNENLPDPYVLLEFPSVIEVKSVFLRTQPAGNLVDKMVEVEVKIGNSSSTGDFNQYQLISKFFGPIQEYDIDLVFQRSIPMYGKFIAVHGVGNVLLQICMIEVY